MCCLCFCNSCNAVCVSDLGRHLGEGGVTGTMEIENEALRPSLTTIHPLLTVRLTVGLENALCALGPYFSSYADQCTCFDVVYLFRPYTIVFLYQI